MTLSQNNHLPYFFLKKKNCNCPLNTLKHTLCQRNPECFLNAPSMTPFQLNSAKTIREGKARKSVHYRAVQWAWLPIEVWKHLFSGPMERPRKVAFLFHIMDLQKKYLVGPLLYPYSMGEEGIIFIVYNILLLRTFREASKYLYLLFPWCTFTS